MGRRVPVLKLKKGLKNEEFINYFKYVFFNDVFTDKFIY